ncbi:hypothetical protein BUALT_Bualt06G0001500 [Buddleja alternifolia]|uniref:Uncharacterized protein n=1 Tax=Buddleja alternifolia TaxID=168488 RepID=A0AAV6XIS3_9LAMI|nr:hypothetical protein BUALT_Bualt06G0001500 [Buddleja alternifolia]
MKKKRGKSIKPQIPNQSLLHLLRRPPPTPATTVTPPHSHELTRFSNHELTRSFTKGGDGVDGATIGGDVPTPLTDENVDCEDINEDGTFTLNEIETEQQQERPKRVLKKSKYQKTPYTEHAPTK